MNKLTRTLTAILVSLLLGGMFAYQNAQKNEPPYQQHPLTVILTDFFCGFLAGLIFYVGSGWLAKRKERKLKQAEGDKFYDEVARELQEKSMVAGLWTKAYAEMGGDDAKTRALYIKFRVEQLAEANHQQLKKVRLAKQIQERPNFIRKIAIISIVTIFVLILVIFVTKITIESGIFGYIASEKILAAEGDANAEYSLGLEYSSGGNGVRKDYTKAFKWFVKSANQNHPDAQYEVGDCYYYGQGIEKNYSEAVIWYRKSAEQGNQYALNMLGVCYEHGEGVEADEFEAYKWYSIAVARGYGNARENLKTIELFEQYASPEQLAKAKQLAAAFVPRTANQQTN